MLTDTRKTPYAQVSGVAAQDVDWEDGFWKERFSVCANVTVSHILGLFERSDSRFHVVDNFRIAAGEKSGTHQGTPFGDGDFYKWLEAAVYTAAKCHDTALDMLLDEYIVLIGKAQQPDGYLSTKQIIAQQLSGDGRRLADINDFEVYNFGHLFTAACMHFRMTGKRSLLDIAIKAAAYLQALYEAAAETGDVQTAVCPSHYMGLIELYRTTGDRQYLDLAKLAIDLRDRIQNGTDDNQDAQPLREHRTIVGHGVRSTYLYAGVADLYAETGDETLLPVLHSVWNDCVQKKLYLTGGCGALYTGVSPYGLFNFVNGVHVSYVHQAFGYAYQLPNLTAYNETCATLGNILWNYRLFCIEPEAKYFDVIERSMLNITLASVSLSGDKYFYENMLRRDSTLELTLMWPRERTSEMDCFCCPPNTARFIAQSSEYAYTLRGDTLWCGMYGASRLALNLPDGAQCTLLQQTAYPWEGAIRFSCCNVSRNAAFRLMLRIPGWVCSGNICVNAAPLRTLTCADAGTYIAVTLENPSVDVIDMTLAMPVRLTAANPKVEEDTNQVAVERGPLVYCVESQDVSGAALSQLLLPAAAVFEEKPCVIGGTTVLALHTEAIITQAQDTNTLYHTLHPGYKKAALRMIPYFAWDNRGFAEMRVWLPLFHGEYTDCK